MKNELKNFYNKWSKEKADEFYNNSPERKPDSYIWEITDSGIFLAREQGCHFLSNDGMVYKLHQWFSYIDDEKHRELFERCKEKNIRIDIPIDNELIEINEKKFRYSSIMRPNREHGQSFWHDLIIGNIDKNYLIDYIKFVERLLTVLKDMNCELPNNGCTINKLMRDSKGIFWSDFKIWHSPYSIFLETIIKDYKQFVDYLSYHIKLTNLYDTIELAEDTWKQI